MKKLEKLDLSWNQFDGMLPTCLSNLKSLRELDLSFNQFTGSVSSSLISNLTSLEYIHLGYNHFTGLFSFSSFANHSKLEVVGLPSNDDNFEVETEYTTWVPKFQLKVLVLSRCNLNKLTGDVPKFLSHQAYLLKVDLSHNNLKGDLPNWMLENNRRLEYLDLRNNSFNGQKFWEMLPCLERLNLAENAFEGQIPPSIYNRFHGPIFSTQFNLLWVQVLLLDNNQFTGTLSHGLFNCSGLEFLDISNNYFSGEIPKWMHGMTSLRTLIMRNNSFHGRIPHEFPDVQECIHGSIPKHVLNPEFLFTLDLGDNNLSGKIPIQLFLRPIPHCFNNMTFGRGANEFFTFPQDLILFFSNRVYFILFTMRRRYEDPYLQHGPQDEVEFITKGRHCIYKGYILNFMSVLDLSFNNLTGKIPYELGQLNSIHALNLSHNRLIGSIPRISQNFTN
ncbi:hypothetical protein AAG906_032890 [Vitis piasezkii]